MTTPFSSGEIKAFMIEKGTEHTTPLWPQANSEVENFMKVITKATWSAHVDGQNWKKDYTNYLLNYLATPHCYTGFSPAQLLFNQQINTKLPQMVSQEKVQIVQKKR